MSNNMLLPPTLETSPTNESCSTCNFQISTPECLNFGTQCLISCEDVEHNLVEEEYPVKRNYACKRILPKPFIPEIFNTLPRMYVMNSNSWENSMTVPVVFGHDRLIIFQVESFDHLMQIVNTLCTICATTPETCRCSHTYVCEIPYILTDQYEVPIISTMQMKNVLGIQSCLHGEFYYVQTQSGKTYTEILCDPEPIEPLIKITEDVLTLFLEFKQSSKPQHLIRACCTFIRSITGRSAVYLLKDVVVKLVKSLSVGTVVQSSNHWTETLSDVYENYAKCKQTILAERIKRVFNHLIAHSLYHKLGIEVDRELFDKFEREKIRINLMDCFTFLDATAALITFLLKQGRQCMIIGSIEPLYISSITTGDWYERSRKVLVQMDSICNPAAIGVELHVLLANLNDCIEEGKSIVKFTTSHHSSTMIVRKMLDDLMKNQNKYMTSIAACAGRKCPFAICIYGAPGIGKCTVMDVLQTYDAKITGKPVGKKYVYPHPAESDHFDNFRTWMHTMIFEDVAQLSPAALKGIDPSVQFFMKAINNAPWCPPQAALEDKGKTPVMVETVIVTSNTLDLHIPVYFPHSYAPMRRFPLHIEPRVRKEFKDSNGGLDYKKAKSVEGEYDDFWEYVIRVPTSKANGNSYVGEFVEKPELFCKNISELLELYKRMCLEHHRRERMMLEKSSNTANVKVCDNCFESGVRCSCDTVVQSEKVSMADYSSSDSEEEELTHYDYGCRCNGTHKEDCSFFTFDQVRDESLEPWRKEMELRPPRKTDMFVMNKFYQLVKIHEPVLSVRYINYHLNKALSLGYTDSEIIKDFKSYCEYIKMQAKVEEYNEFVEVAMTMAGRDKGNGWPGVDTFIKMCMYLYFHFTHFRHFVNHMSTYQVVKRCIVPMIRPSLLRSTNQKYFMRQLGQFLDRKINNIPKWASMLLVAAGSLSAIGLLYKLADAMIGFRSPDKIEIIDDKEDEQLVKDKIESMTSEEVTSSLLEIRERQAMSLEDVRVQMGKNPIPLNEKVKKNSWIVEERKLTSLDFSTKKITEKEVLYRNMSYNTLVCSYFGFDVGKFKTQFRMLALNEFTFITNNHVLEPADFYDLTVYFGDIDSGDKVRVRIQNSQIERLALRDLAIIRTKSIPNRFKRIQNNFPKRSYCSESNGFIYIKAIDGSIEKKNLLSQVPYDFYETINGTRFCYKGYTGRLEIPTENGESGSPWVAETGYGPMILGLHTILRQGCIGGCTAIYHEDVMTWCTPMMSEVGVIETVTPIVQKEKSYIDYHKEKYVTYHGELQGFRARPKHHVYETELAEQVFGRTVCGFKIERRLTGPVMDNWRPQQVSLTEFLTPVCTMDEVVLDKCLSILYKHIDESLPFEEKNLLHPYPMEVAINGAPGITFVDGIKKSTSMGYPWKQTKRAYLIPLEDEMFPDGVKFTAEVEERILERLERLKKGVRMHPIFSASLKDEPVSFKKFLACKTRVFFCCPADFLILVRMCFMSFCRVVQRNPLVFGVAVGMNPHSSDWEKIYQFLAHNPTCNTIAGDHVFYDKKMQLVLLRSIMLMVIRLFEKYGNLEPEELCVYYALVEDMVNPTVDYFGMLITLMGGEVSGHQMTTILNCLCTLVYCMYVYHIIYNFVEDFFEKIRCITLGDDHVVTVPDDRKEFNHTRIQSELQILGLNYTMADKNSESVPFINLEDAPFLKRTFEYFPPVGATVGPIDKNTIFKMLTVNVESKAVTKEEQLAQSMCAAVAESFFHGKVFFDAFVQFIDSLVKSARLKEQMKKFPFLTWDGYIKRYYEASEVNVASPLGPNQKVAECSSDCFEKPIILQSLKRMDYTLLIPARAFPKICIYRRLELEPKEGDKGLRPELTVDHENQQLANPQQLTGSYADKLVPDTATESSDTIQQTTMFVNEPVAETLDLSQPFDVVGKRQQITATLGDFLKRPVLLTQYRWTENGSAGLKSSFNPFELYFTTPAIANKLAGFGMIRPKLKLKFLVNGSPFYYGKIGAFYRPLSNASDLTVTAGTTAMKQILVSQRPHVWLDNQSTSNEEMVLPFLYPNLYAPTSLLDMRNLGVVELWQFATLRSANGVSTSGIDITIYGYCEEFELAGPTNRTVLQSKKEYVANGQISGPASTVASVASKLKQVPIISPFASATETAAKTVGSIASLFGFTNVPNVRDVEPIKPIPFQLASSTISEPVMKLSLQPKQEIAVGSSYCGGSDEDELMITKLLQRESFLCGTLWSTTAAANDTLFVSQVTPALYEFDSTTSSVAHTPISYWSCMFEYWRGSIIFRFKVVRSPYHRGRLNINWDQNARTIPVIPNFGNANTMNVVLDLDECDEAEIEIPYTQATTFMKCLTANWTFPTARTWENSSSVPILAAGEFNGMISVKVMNRLTAPEATSDVDLLVFVRAGKDFAFAAPCEINSNWSHSGTENTVLQSQKTYMVGDEDSNSLIFKEVFGENIVSIRELLHRSSLSFNHTPSVSSASGLFNITIPLKRYPRPPGFYNNGWELAETATSGVYKPYNYSRMTHLNWVLPVFVGYKGSVNVTINVVNNFNGNHLDRIEVCRRNIKQSVLDSVRRPFSLSVADSQTFSRRAKTMNDQALWGHDGLSGLALTNQKTNAGICVNLPFYSVNKFLSTDPYVQYSNEDTVTQSEEDWFDLQLSVYKSSASVFTNGLFFQIYYASGPDFDVVFNLGCPVVFYKDRLGSP